MFDSKLLLATLAVGIAGTIHAQSLSNQDKKFIEDAAKGGMKEVQMGKMGLDKGSGDGLKRFSQKLVDDHSAANQELKGLASKKGVTLPADDGTTGMGSMMMSKKTGMDFDKAFAAAMVDDHKKDIAEFEKEAKMGSDPDVKSWASKTLPTLKAHLAAAQALNH